MSAGKHNVSVILTTDERAHLKVRAALLGVSVSTLVHQALELGGYLKPVPATPASDRSAPTDPA